MLKSFRAGRLEDHTDVALENMGHEGLKGCATQVCVKTRQEMYLNKKPFARKVVRAETSQARKSRILLKEPRTPAPCPRPPRHAPEAEEPTSSCV